MDENGGPVPVTDLGVQVQTLKEGLSLGGECITKEPELELERAAARPVSVL